MTNNEILNTKIPRTNSQIQKASVKKRAIAIASAFLFGDIQEMGRNFDNLWENGNSDDISKELAKIYYSNSELKEACDNSRFFSKAMINES